MRRAALLFIGTFLLAVQAEAQQAPAAAGATEADPWLIKTALGYIATSGNTESSSLNSGFSISYDDDLWLHSLEGTAINSSENKQTTAEAYGVGWKSEYSLTKSDFLFVRVNWRRDRFSGYEQQLSETIGYGRRLIDTGSHVLNVEVGAGARQAELADGTMDGGPMDELIKRGGLSYEWDFSETAEFAQTVAVESGPDNTWVETVSAVKARLVEDLALVASYTIKSNSSVPADSENTDRYLAISLEYAF
jgi:putative salt-induced outer membrane protein